MESDDCYSNTRKVNKIIVIFLSISPPNPSVVLE